MKLRYFMPWRNVKLNFRGDIKTNWSGIAKGFDEQFLELNNGPFHFACRKSCNKAQK